MSSFSIVGTVSKASTLKQLLRQEDQLTHCDIVELRFDEYMNLEECLQLCTDLQKHKAVLLTIRTKREGGTWEISDQHRYELFKKFAPHVDYIDIELKSELFKNFRRSDFPKELKIIGSFHNYINTPSKQEIDALITSGRNWGLDIVKLACVINNKQEYSRLESFLCQDKICLIGMGEEGVRTRTEFPPKGSLLTYGFLDDSAAPGQLSARELWNLLREHQ